MKYKKLLIFFEGFSLKQIKLTFLEGENPTFNYLVPSLISGNEYATGLRPLQITPFQLPVTLFGRSLLTFDFKIFTKLLKSEKLK